MNTKKTLPVKRRPQRPNALGLLALLLFSSAVLRVGDRVGVAWAEPNAPTLEPAIERADRVLGMSLNDQTLPDLLDAFKARETRLLEAEQNAKIREEGLARSAQAIAEQLRQLEAAEEKLASTLAITDTAAAADLDRLAAVYENMKPRDTAELFAEMAPGFAAGFLGLMRPESAAAIMTELEPQTAHIISVMLAGRNANAPSSR